MKRHIFLFLIIITAFCGAQNHKDIDYPLLGKVQPRSSHEIASSNWSIGGETMDRDFTDFEQWKSYLGPTGAKKIRLQAGWEKCETKKGEYNFEWLDKIIDGVIVQGVEPWLQVSYGNPIYEGGGLPYLVGGFPVSEEALTAWDNWVKALVDRYQGRVKIWEVWNESNANKKNTPQDYARLFIRSAEIIRSAIPDAKLYAISLAIPDGQKSNLLKDGHGPFPTVGYVKDFLEYMKGVRKLDLVDVITLHGYTKTPEDIYGRYSQIERVVASYADHIILGQGELGCPSEYQEYYALHHYPWTEASQCKWLLRRLLGDLGHDMPSLYFGIIDTNYTINIGNKNGEIWDLEEPIKTVNTKGLIKSNPDNTVAYVKPAYRTYQNITSIFDHNLLRVPNYAYSVNSDVSLSVFGYRSKNFDNQIVVIWQNDEIPSDSEQKTQMTFEFSAGNFVTPVYIDLKSGEVYEIPKTNWKRNGTKYTFKNVPIYDSPILIAEKALIILNDL